jgi:hypothetical protein
MNRLFAASVSRQKTLRRKHNAGAFYPPAEFVVSCSLGSLHSVSAYLQGNYILSPGWEYFIDKASAKSL